MAPSFDHWLYLFAAPPIFLGLSVVLARIRKMPASTASNVLFLMIVIILGWIVSGAFMVQAINQSQAYFWLLTCQFFIIPTVPVWSFFILCVLDESRWNRPIIWGSLLAFVVIIWVFMFTNPLHHQFWKTIRFLPQDGIMISEVQFGGSFWLYTGTSYAIFLISTILFYKVAAGEHGVRKKEFSWIVWSGIIPFAANSMHKLQLIPGFEKDFTPIFFGFSAFFLNKVLREYLDEGWRSTKSDQVAVRKSL